MTYVLIIGVILKEAEEEGFEPPDLLQSTVFKTAAIDHSAIPPDSTRSLVLRRRKVNRNPRKSVENDLF